MALKVRITLRAALQIEVANRWWVQNRAGVREAFADDIQAGLNLLALQPGIGTQVVSVRAKNLRRLHLGRIRYFVYYRVKAGELVVVAVWHSSRTGKPTV